MKIKQWLAAFVAITGIALPVLAQNRTAPMNFAGRYLVSISDADMVASAYIDGNLGSREGEDVINVSSTKPKTRKNKNFKLFCPQNKKAIVHLLRKRLISRLNTPRNSP
ncbi:MAG: hypothetical protein AB4368_05340 [Xenococcaceae cyanobacterium]